MVLTIDSAKAVHVTVHEMALFLRGKRSELICHFFFPAPSGCHTVCACSQVCAHVVPAQESGSWQEVGWLLAFALFHSQRIMLSPTVPELCFSFYCVWAEPIRYSPKSCGPRPGRVESWGCCLGLGSSCRYMEEPVWLQIRDKPSSCAYFMGNSHKGIVFEEWPLDMWWWAFSDTVLYAGWTESFHFYVVF